MALSEQTSESLKKAEVHLRDALAFEARVEKPYVVRELGGIIAHLDNIQGTETLFDKMTTAIDRIEKEQDKDEFDKNNLKANIRSQQKSKAIDKVNFNEPPLQN